MLFSTHNSFVPVILSRFAQAILTAFGASVLIWAILPLASGDVAMRTLQARGVENPRDAEIVAIREDLQLDKPLIIQYFAWLSRAVQGNLGVSFQSGKPVVAEFIKRLPATLFLAGLTLIFSVSLAVILALTGAFYRASFINQIVTFITFTAVSLPAFLLGLLILQFVVLEFGFGRVIAGGAWQDALFPALCLTLGRASEWAQILRAGILEELGKNYVFVARARGASAWRVVWRYALPNALLPFLTVVGIGIGSLLGGAAVIEAVFSYPGIGSYVFAAIEARDLPVIQGFVVIATLIYMSVNLAIDTLSAWLNPIQ